jgi:group I intron endonuclease
MQLDKFEIDLKLDAPTPWGYFFQDSATPQMEGVEELHNNIMFYLAIILFTVTWMMITIIRNFISSKSFISHKYMNHGKFVPIQKCSKFNTFLKSKMYTCIRTYTTLPCNLLGDTNELNSVKLYENSYDLRKDILKENKGKSGIYMLTNKLTNDIYIGQSADISKRFKNYFNLSYIKSKDSFKISKALIKYGYSNFSVTILEYCDKSDLLAREQYYFDKLNPQYNILKMAPRYFKQSEETKKFMSLKKAKDNNPLFDKTYSKDSIKLIKQMALGRRHSEDTKLKMSAIRGNPVNIYEKCSSDGFKLIGSFVSARRAGKFLEISGSTVIRYMNSGEIFKDRYKFSSK